LGYAIGIGAGLKESFFDSNIMGGVLKINKSISYGNIFPGGFDVKISRTGVEQEKRG
jgi:hypothetical protein